MEKTMDIEFLGTGTSLGVPLIGCHCKVCKSSNAKDHRLRSSLLIKTESQNFVIDSGPDFRQQMLRTGIERIDGILLTHAHYDHVGGLEDIRAFNFLQQKPLDIYAQDIVVNDIHKKYDYAFVPNPYPGVPQMSLHVIDSESPFQIGDTEIVAVQAMHAKLMVYGYRIGNFAYVTDANYIPKKEIEKLRNLDVLVINALRKSKHLSHFNVKQALEVVTEVQPKRTYFTHISHDMGLHSEVEKGLPANVYLAYDGLEVRIN